MLYLGGLALLDTLSPTIIGVTLYLILTANKKLPSRLFFYLFTVLLLYFSLGVLLVAGLQYTLDIFTNVFENKIFSWIVFIIGAVLFVASFFLPSNRKSPIPIPKSLSIVSVIIIGTTTFLIEAGTAFPYYAAIGLLTANQIPLSQGIPIIALYNVVMVLPALLIFSGYTLFAKQLTPIIAKLYDKLANNSDSTLSWVMSIIGLLLIFITLDYI